MIKLHGQLERPAQEMHPGLGELQHRYVIGMLRYVKRGMLKEDD